MLYSNNQHKTDIIELKYAANNNKFIMERQKPEILDTEEHIEGWVQKGTKCIFHKAEINGFEVCILM